MKTKLGQYKREYGSHTQATFQESHAEQEITLKVLGLLLFQWSNGNGLGEVFDLLDLQVAWTLLVLQLMVIYWHEAHKRCSSMVTVQRENRLLQQEGNQALQGWHWWSREGQRAKHDRKRRQHTSKCPDEGKSSTPGSHQRFYMSKHSGERNLTSAPLKEQKS